MVKSPLKYMGYTSPETIKEVALAALLGVTDDATAPAAARASAGRTLLEAIGVLGRNQDVSKLDEQRGASEMTPTEIREEIARLSRRLPPVKIRKVK